MLQNSCIIQLGFTLNLLFTVVNVFPWNWTPQISKFRSLRLEQGFIHIIQLIPVNHIPAITSFDAAGSETVLFKQAHWCICCLPAPMEPQGNNMELEWPWTKWTLVPKFFPTLHLPSLPPPSRPVSGNFLTTGPLRQDVGTWCWNLEGSRLLTGTTLPYTWSSRTMETPPPSSNRKVSSEHFRSLSRPIRMSWSGSS